MNTDDVFGPADVMFNIESKPDVYDDIPSQIKTGGDIKMGTLGILQYIIVAVVILLLIYILIQFAKKIEYFGEDYYQRKTHEAFDQITGDQLDSNARTVIQYGEQIPNPRAIDHYRVGAVYLLNARDARNARNHFDRALQEIINQRAGILEGDFIIDRVMDLQEYFVNHPEVEDLPIQEALVAQANIQRDTIREVKNQIKTKRIDENDPEFTQKVILSQKHWQSDSQNVHDTALYEEIAAQYNVVKHENCKIPKVHLHNYQELRDWYMSHYRQSDHLSKINKVFTMIDNNYAVMHMQGVHEQDIITSIWRRMFDPRNKQNFNKMRESLGDALIDCVENDHVVCMAGRISKIWQTLAMVDCNPSMGILKTKMLLKNEIYDRCSKIVDDYVGIENGSATAQLKEAYANDEKTPQVEELKQCMLKQMDDLVPQYSELLPEEQVRSIIKVCKAVV